MSRYPEHDKMHAVADRSQAIGEFLDTGGYVLARYIRCRQYHGDGGICANGEHLVPVGAAIETILADYFDVDLRKVEAEKRAMLALMRTNGQ